MRKFTYEQILDALQRCAKEKFEECEKCAYYDKCKSGNYTQIFTDALDLIKRQEERIAALKADAERRITVDERYKYCNVYGDAYIYTKSLLDYNDTKKAIGAETIKALDVKLAAALANNTYATTDEDGKPAVALRVESGENLLDLARKIIEEVTT